MDDVQDPSVVQDPPVDPPAAPPAEPSVVPAAPPAEPPATPPPALAGQQMTEPQWVELEQRLGMPRKQIILSYAMTKTVMDNDPVIVSTKEKAALADAREALLAVGVKDFDSFEDSVKKSLKAKTGADRQNVQTIVDTFWAEKGKKSSIPANPQNNGQVPSVPSQPRRVTGVSTGGPGPVDPTPTATDEGMDDFQKHVARKYDMKDSKEYRENGNKEVPLNDEYDFKPDFKRR